MGLVWQTASAREKAKPQRVVFIGLDGTPYTFLQRLIAEGRAPNAARLAEQGSLLRMDSMWPWVSSVAWSTMMTGVNPAKHNIFGFIDRDPATYKQFIPTSRHMKAKTLWEVLSDAGKRVVVVNVPVTYPPRQVNGILVGGFLSPSLDKAVYPASYLPTLKSLGYIVDADPWKARESKDLALQEVNAALDARIRTLFHLFDNEEWDYLHVHVMETDRLHHFLWQQMDEDDPIYAPAFYDFYRRIDDMLGQAGRQAGRQHDPDVDGRPWLLHHQERGLRQSLADGPWLAQAAQRAARPQKGAGRDRSQLCGLQPGSGSGGHPRAGPGEGGLCGAGRRVRSASRRDSRRCPGAARSRQRRADLSGRLQARGAVPRPLSWSRRPI